MHRRFPLLHYVSGSAQRWSEATSVSGIKVYEVHEVLKKRFPLLALSVWQCPEATRKRPVCLGSTNKKHKKYLKIKKTLPLPRDYPTLPLFSVCHTDSRCVEVAPLPHLQSIRKTGDNKKAPAFITSDSPSFSPSPDPAPFIPIDRKSVV